MHYKLFLFVLSVKFGAMLQAQERIVFDTVFLSKEYNSFFEKNPAVKEIVLSSGRKELRGVSVKLHTDAGKEKYYNLSFAGDRYLFEKNYSAVAPPTVYIDMLSVRVCSYYWSTSLRIVSDTISANLRYFCKLNPDEIYFEKVETGVRYPHGLKHLDRAIGR